MFARASAYTKIGFPRTQGWEPRTAGEVVPTLVVEVKFDSWTEDGKLRNPRFLGVRTDKLVGDVGREMENRTACSR